MSLLEVDRRLRACYGDVRRRPLPLGNRPDPLDELILMTLSQRTHGSGAFYAYDALKVRFPRWADLLRARESTVFRLVEPSGLAPLKVLRIRRMLRQIKQDYGDVTLGRLRRMSDADAFEYLAKHLRAGAKTALCVMLYSLRRDVFPADAHCLRMLRRLGLIPLTLKHETANRRMHDVVPEGIRYSLHVNMIHHGRAVCTGRRPTCSACCLADLCPRMGVADAA